MFTQNPSAKNAGLNSIAAEAVWPTPVITAEVLWEPMTSAVSYRERGLNVP